MFPAGSKNGRLMMGSAWNKRGVPCVLLFRCLLSRTLAGKWITRSCLWRHQWIRSTPTFLRALEKSVPGHTRRPHRAAERPHYRWERCGFTSKRRAEERWEISFISLSSESEWRKRLTAHLPTVYSSIIKNDVQVYENIHQFALQDVTCHQEKTIPLMSV